MPTTTTPIWLQLKKEYIDDNFDALANYLQQKIYSDDNDDFYQTTLDLLRQRIKMLTDDLADKPIYETDVDKKQIVFNIRLLALFLFEEPNSSLGVTAYVAFMSELRHLHPHMADLTMKATMQRMRHERITSLGFSWGDMQKIETELFAHNACTNSRFSQPVASPLCYSLHGTAIQTSEELWLTHSKPEKLKELVRNGVNSIETGFGIALRTIASQKIKQSQEKDLDAMNEYVSDFVAEQAKIENVETAPKLKSYSDEEEAIIRITEINANGTVHVETVDPAYNKLIGTLRWKHSSLVYYYTDTLYEYFEVGDYFRSTVSDSANGTFSLDKQLVEFFVEDTHAAEEDGGSVFACKLIDDSGKKYAWLNQYGIAFQTDPDRSYQKGDYANLEIRSYGSDKYYGVIFADICDPSPDHFDEKTVRRDCIRAFAESTDAPVYEQPAPETGDLSPVVLKLVLRQLYELQKNQLKPSDRYHLLANAYVMAVLVGDEQSASFLQFESTYLRQLIQFVNGQPVSDEKLQPDAEYKGAQSTLIRLSVIELLKEYGKTENSEKLADAIADFEDRLPMLARLARLIQTANSMQGTLSDAALNVIRREIIKTLSLETENDADLEADGGIYLGVESGTMEFKTSMVFPPDKENRMQPNETLQNHNVLKGICAFLNSTSGGTLYLGVNDQGYVSGIENDMQFLSLQTIDSYLRYVQDTVKKHLGIDVLTYIRIEPLYDNRVVAVHIDSHPYRLVELEGIAYLRVNAESREMPENVREEIIAQKVFKDKNRAAAISLLQHACSIRRCAILHGYASSHSGLVRDRLVEPYDVKPDDGLLIAFDCDDMKSKVFNINRIGYVEVQKEEPWKHQASHEPIQVDVFHMSGTTPIHINLQLDLMAKNLLVEEFPAAKGHISPHKGDDNIWYFSANVYSLAGVGRFVIGLANHVRILEGEELKKYLKEYISGINI